MPSDTSYVCELSPAQADKLKNILLDRGWTVDKIQYSIFRAKKDKMSVVAFESGKLTVQGKGTKEFVQFTLEPEILGEARFGYETELALIENPKMFQPHAGIDESGKGDFLGPLVIACAYTDETAAKALLKAGVADSKTIKSDSKMKALDSIIRKQCAGHFAVVAIGPEAYNRMYESFGNLNRLLAWGHSKALENLLELVPDCPRAISDQFAASKSTVKNALGERGRRIQLEQHPKAEADVAVAAASILARTEFVRFMERLGKQYDMTLPKGGGPAATEAAQQFVKVNGKEALGKIAKLHFKNSLECMEA